MSILRDVGLTFDQAAENIAERLDRWILDLHKPVDLGDETPYCTNHWGKPIPWPCDDWTRAADRIAARRDVEGA